MKKIMMEEVRKIYLGVLSGTITRDEAEKWAYKKMQLFDYCQLEFEPSADEDKIWDGIPL